MGTPLFCQYVVWVVESISSADELNLSFVVTVFISSAPQASHSSREGLLLPCALSAIWGC